jgi:hypothetical protein
MAKFQKGHKKVVGREKGTPNKRTAQWEVFADYCLNGGLKKYQEELNKLEGDKYVSAFNNLLEFHKPKLARSDVNHSGDITIVPPIIKIQPLD